MLDMFNSIKGYIYEPSMYVLKIAIIIAVAFIVVKFGNFVIKKIFDKQKTFKYGINNRRIDTMSTLARSIFKYGVYIIAVVTILTDVFDVKSILAAAGIGGIAIGFGAQSLIKDVLSGFFIVFEDQFVVGDIITIDNLNGTVEEMELRVTRLRNHNGDLYIVPNGEIKRVINHTRGNKSAIIDIPLDYSVNIEKAIKIANDMCEDVVGQFSVIVEDPKVLGITEFGKDSLTLRIVAKTLPNEHFEVERQIRKMVKEAFSKANIEFFSRNRIILQSDNNNLE